MSDNNSMKLTAGVWLCLALMAIHDDMNTEALVSIVIANMWVIASYFKDSK